MSVAFTKEQDYEAQAADLPDRPVSPHPNLVTPSGLAAIEAELASAREAYAAAQAKGGVDADRTAMARATRDLRYWGARRASAQLTPDPEDADVVRFGGTVAFARDDGREQRFRIVGEDEADPADGRVSYRSPLAQALLGKGVGDVATLAGAEVKITAISLSPSAGSGPPRRTASLSTTSGPRPATAERAPAKPTPERAAPRSPP